jgi:hypothetical protein
LADDKFVRHYCAVYGYSGKLYVDITQVAIAGIKEESMEYLD